MGRLAILILLSSFMIGCASTPEIQYVPTVIKITCDEAPKPLPLNMLPVEWQLTSTEEGMYALGLDGEQYSNLSINMENIVGYIITQKEVIKYYEKCVKSHNEKGAE
jgi:hypothetical protein